MFYYNALLKLLPNRWTLGIVVKVLLFIHAMMRKISSLTLSFRPSLVLFFNLLKWLELFFSFFFSSSAAYLLRTPPWLIQFNINLFRHDERFVTIVYETTQTQNCITEKSILLRSQWLIRLLGKWIWRWRIYTKMTSSLTPVLARMHWESQMLV